MFSWGHWGDFPSSDPKFEKIRIEKQISIFFQSNNFYISKTFQKNKILFENIEK